LIWARLTFLLMVVCAAVLIVSAPILAAASEAEAPAPWTLANSFWALGGQITEITQGNTRMHSPYSNPTLSFGPGPTLGWTLTTSLFGAVTPWPDALIAIEPEYADGRGMPNASGLAGYPNAEIIRVPALASTPYLARVFYHQDFPLTAERVEAQQEFEARFMPAGAHPPTREQAPSRLELTIGKIAANDFFDVSAIASDQRHGFMNWALIDQGAWDFMADTRGYTWAAVLALETPRLALRGAVGLMPTTANGPNLDWNLAHHRSEMVEGEYHYRMFERPGTIKIMAYLNHAHMGRYSDALAQAGSGATPDIHRVERVGAIKSGGGLLVDQQISTDVALFLRLGANDGQTETFAFTEIDRSASLGAQLRGSAWGRAGDRVGLAIAVSGLSDVHAQYLSAGGRGFQLGDGGLSYALETLAEMYYSFPITRYVELAFDAQTVVNPGMNSSRGAVAIFGFRLHAHL
jgi:high affinity Mn2+ porin